MYTGIGRRGSNFFPIHIIGDSASLQLNSQFVVAGWIDSYWRRLISMKRPCKSNHCWLLSNAVVALGEFPSGRRILYL